MADNKKYYYLKLKNTFFDDDTIIVLESMQDGYLYTNILLKLYLKSLKNEGKLVFNDRIPYNANLLAQVTRHSVGVIERALKVFVELNLIEIVDGGAIYMLDIQNFIGKSSSEGDRKREYRKIINEERQKTEADICLDKCPTNVRQVSTHSLSENRTKKPTEQMFTNGENEKDKCPDERPPELELELELELEKEIEIEIEKEKEREGVKTSAKFPLSSDYQKIIDLFHACCPSLPEVQKITEKRKQRIKARLKELDNKILNLKKIFERVESSQFCTGNNDRGWVATFDWIMKSEDIIINISEGKYDNKSNAKKHKTGGNVFFEYAKKMDNVESEVGEDL
ncbi:MAG: phage replisome organizer N-terminal domain-containing protein [Alkaliphilus sp.]